MLLQSLKYYRKPHGLDGELSVVSLWPRSCVDNFIVNSLSTVFSIGWLTWNFLHGKKNVKIFFYLKLFGLLKTFFKDERTSKTISNLNFWITWKVCLSNVLSALKIIFFFSVPLHEQVYLTFVCIHFWWKMWPCEGEEKNTTSVLQNQLQFASRSIRKHWNLSLDRVQEF